MQKCAFALSSRTGGEAADQTRGERAGVARGGSPGVAQFPAPSGKLGAKPGPGAAGNIGALMVQ